MILKKIIRLNGLLLTKNIKMNCLLQHYKFNKTMKVKKKTILTIVMII